MDVLRLGPLRVEPVSVGIFFKRSSVFASLRPRDRWTNLSFKAPGRIDDPRITNAVAAGRGRTYHVVRLRGPADVDDDVSAWLGAAYLGDGPT